MNLDPVAVVAAGCLIGGMIVWRFIDIRPTAIMSGGAFGGIVGYVVCVGLSNNSDEPLNTMPNELESLYRMGRIYG